MSLIKYKIIKKFKFLKIGNIIKKSLPVVAIILGFWYKSTLSKVRFLEKAWSDARSTNKLQSKWCNYVTMWNVHGMHMTVDFSISAEKEQY